MTLNALARRLFLPLFAVSLAGPAFAQTKLLRYPDVHGDALVFTYAGDLWRAPSAGGSATRLTAHPGLELFGKFSPDGNQIAFTGQYDGDEQVYVVPASGGGARAAHVLSRARAAEPARGVRQPGLRLDAGRQAGRLPLAARRRRRSRSRRRSTRSRPAAACPCACPCRPPAPATSRPTASGSSTRRASATSVRGSATRAAGRRTCTCTTWPRPRSRPSRPTRGRSATRCGSATASTSCPTATAR